MLINELSKKAGVSIHTLRYYENLGLINGETDDAVTSNNYKNYDESLLERIEIIKDAKEAGFTLAEIKKMLDSWYGGNYSAEEQLKMVDIKIAEVDIKISQLKQVKKRLQKVRKEIESDEC